jgi:hypothetical protein
LIYIEPHNAPARVTNIPGNIKRGLKYITEINWPSIMIARGLVLACFNEQRKIRNSIE